MHPGETQVRRLGNAGADILYKLHLDGYHFTVIGEDGTPVLRRPTFLVDGRVHGTWFFDTGTLRFTPFRPLCATDRAALEQEADRLLAFVGGEMASYSDPVAAQSSRGSTPAPPLERGRVR
ncbi:DNA glycosylase AlkZ-like family protein [Streptomyces mirabilis]|uniref:DNA glycosylase AlkZ-like family protein n=1 Tax=Streptomyces mirabilis TaxID=68239 RepID=UPI0036906C9B